MLFLKGERVLKKFWMWAIPCGVMFVGCAGSPPMMDESAAGEGYFFVSGRYYNESYDKVFETLKERLRKKGYSLNRVDKDAGIISTFSRSLEGSDTRRCQCRSLRGFSELGRKVRMTFIVDELSTERTHVSVRSRFTAYWSDGRATVERTCASDGQLEKDVMRF
jgi:hypothetical protein